MITMSEDGTTATVVFPWPSNDSTAVRAMRAAAGEALSAAGHRVTRRPEFHDLRRAGDAWEFVFTAPVSPGPTQEVSP